MLLADSFTDFLIAQTPRYDAFILDRAASSISRLPYLRPGIIQFHSPYDVWPNWFDLVEDADFPIATVESKRLFDAGYDAIRW